MYAKAYRWVAELDEIGAFVGDDHAEHEMLEAAARLYERIAGDADGKKIEIGASTNSSNPERKPRLFARVTEESPDGRPQSMPRF